MLTNQTDARRYFKQSEIVLYRQAPEIAATPQIAQQQIHQQQQLEAQNNQQPLAGAPAQHPQHIVPAAPA